MAPTAEFPISTILLLERGTADKREGPPRGCKKVFTEVRQRIGPDWFYTPPCKQRTSLPEMGGNRSRRAVVVGFMLAGTFAWQQAFLR
jgi:hypothetical protein